MCELIASEARRFKYLLNSDRLDDDEKKLYRDLISLQEGRETVLAVKLKFSLKKISELLYKHYNQKVIVLIDEYDVPLDKAFQHGYYREMVSLKDESQFEVCCVDRMPSGFQGEHLYGFE